MHFDTEPITEVIKPKVYEKVIDKPTLTAYSTVKSILTSINRLRIDAQEEKYMPKDAKYFFLNNGAMTYNNSCLVEYDYKNDMFTKEMLDGIEFDDNEYNVSYYGTIVKDKLIFSSDNYKVPKNKPFDLSDEKFYPIDEDELIKLAEAEVYPTTLNLRDNIKIRMVNRAFYFPFKNWLKQILLARDSKGLPKKEPEISTPVYRYEKLEETTKIQFQYSIYHKELIHLYINIYMQIKNI